MGMCVYVPVEDRIVVNMYAEDRYESGHVIRGTS